MQTKSESRRKQCDELHLQPKYTAEEMRSRKAVAAAASANLRRAAEMRHMEHIRFDRGKTTLVEVKSESRRKQYDEFQPKYTAEEMRSRKAVAAAASANLRRAAEMRHMEHIRFDRGKTTYLDPSIPPYHHIPLDRIPAYLYRTMSGG